MRRIFYFVLFVAANLQAAEHHGIVKFGGLPVPGATITATQGDRRFTAVSALDGTYSFAELAAGTWNLQVDMRGFAKANKELIPETFTTPTEWELTMLPLDQMNAQALAAPPPAAEPAGTTKAPERPAPSENFPNIDPEELTRRAADGFLINGTANNSAASPFSQSAAFGNNRRGGRPLYTGNIGVILGNSHLDAKPYSLTGQNTPRPDYNRIQGVASFGGPIRIPHLIRRGPNVTVDYQWSRQRSVTTQSAVMPSLAERSGIFPSPIIDPTTGLPFPSNAIPVTRVSPQATSLLTLYPLPNFDSSRYNYQVPIVGDTHQDSLQSRFQHRLPRRNQIWGNFAWQSTRTDNPTLFQFLDTGKTAGINSSIYWLHMFRPRLYTTAGYQYSRLATGVTSFFANRANISGAAGITGNNQDPINWGPPSLQFSSGIAGLSDGIFASNRNQTSGVSSDTTWNQGAHNITFGVGYRRQQFNVLSQEDPRGTFSFTGAAAGSDFAGFLLGIPDTSAIAFGNADKYLRAASADAYITDDYRLRSGLTLNIGLRWEYSSPLAERYGRLVNLDIGASFSTAIPRVAGDGSPLRPDRNNLAPRLAFAWRPLAASSLIIRGGYGVYYDTSVYQPIVLQLTQQSPLSTSLRVENSPSNPLTLANGFNASPSITRNTFAVDPTFRIGYSQNWQVSVQRDLPASLAMVATYAGVKGTRAQQQFLPNTYPTGAVNPCAACPSGFAYLVSNGNSTRQSGQIEIRRRLRAGFAATVQYTYAKSIDNAALGGRNQGGVLIAQNWLDLRAERARSNFDQRHSLSLQTAYTTGMGPRGGMFLRGWRGGLFKEWTLSAQLTAGTGLPLTPIYFTSVRGTGVTGSVRPDYTGAALYAAPPGLFLNPAAYAAPAPGQWGDAGRNTITGPSQFTLNASLGRVLRLGDRMSFDMRVEASNVLNHPVFPSWNAIVTNSQFGLPNPANAMRTIQTTARLRF